MSTPPNVRHPIVLVLVLLASIAFAQTTAYENPQLGFRFSQPDGWAPSEDVAPDGTLTLQFMVPSGQGAVGVAAVPIDDAERAYWTGPREELVRDVWAGFVPEVPDAQINQTYEVTVDGALASVIDYASPSVAGTIVVIVGSRAAFTFFSAGDQASLATVQGGLETMLGSFAFLPGGAPVAQAGGGGGSSPIAGTPPVGPTNPALPANPMNPSAPVNPLGATPPGSGGNPYVGEFADDRLRLTLDAASNGLAGTLVFDDARYPVTAQATDGGVSGHFLVGGVSYGFEARLDGDNLTFVTDEVRYVLQRTR